MSHGGRREGAGRKAGVPNKTTTQLKEAILEAATKAGGEGGLVGYLGTLATTNTSAFAALLGKVLPLTVNGEGEDGAIKLIHTIERRIVKNARD